MSGLKTFIISEAVKINHAERYLSYLEKYHVEVLHDLRKILIKSWETSISKLLVKNPPNIELVQYAQLKNPKATIQLALVTKPEKVLTSRTRTTVEVHPSIKIPFVYPTSERQLLTKHLLSDADSAIKELVSKWKQIFNYESKGRLQPWFKIVHDDASDEIRLQLSLNEGSVEAFKTLYSIRVEYGKSSSKLRDYDRIYLISLA